MNRLQTLIGWIFIGALLAGTYGCAGSPSPRYYYLSSISGSAPEGKRSSEGPCVSIGLGPIEIPDYLDQSQIVIRVGPNEIKLADSDRWAEPLKENFTRALARNLSSLVCIKEVSFFPWRREIPTDYRVEMNIISFDGRPGEKVILETWWRLLSGDGKTVLQSKRISFSEPVGGRDYQFLIVAHSRALEQLSRDVAETIKTVSKQ